MQGRIQGWGPGARPPLYLGLDVRRPLPTPPPPPLSEGLDPPL